MRKIRRRPRVAPPGSLEPSLMDPCLDSTQERTSEGDRRSTEICTSGIRGWSWLSMRSFEVRPTSSGSAIAGTCCLFLRKPTRGTDRTCRKSDTRFRSPSAPTSCALAQENSQPTTVCMVQPDPLRGDLSGLIENWPTRSTLAHGRLTWAIPTTSARSCARPLAGHCRSMPSRSPSWTCLFPGRVERSLWRLDTREAPSCVGEGLSESGCNRFTYMNLTDYLISSSWQEQMIRRSVLTRGLS